MNKTFGIMASTVVATLLASGANATPAKKAAKADAPYCQNNTCKGKSECKGHGNGCTGKNECKGHGMLKAKDEAECTAKSGVWMTASAAPAAKKSH